MKTQRKTSVSKMIARFDNELKNILLNDLAAVRNTKNQLVNTIKSSLNNHLSAA